MTREELQQQLRKLEEMKKDAMCNHENRLCEITEQQQDSLRALNKKKFEALELINNAKREVDSVMRKANRDEQIRFKVAVMEIEYARQQLFADYKAQSDEYGARPKETEG